VKEVANNDQQAADKQAVIAALRKTIADKKASTVDKTRAADCLRTMAEYNWFSKPNDPAQQNTDIDANTAKRLVEIAERLGLPCPKCGASLL
jgi:hypothetical protein